MNWTKTLIIITVMASQLACTNSAPETVIHSEDKNKYLIEAEDLAAIMDQDSVVIIDMRKSEAYEQGHIKGAFNIWRSNIQQDSVPYSGMIASKQKIEKLLGNLGIAEDAFLVLYDDKSSCEAARMWWVLDYYGFQNTALLNGGIKAWNKTNAISLEVPSTHKTRFSFAGDHNRSRHISLEEIIEATRDSSIILIDTRTAEEYRGEVKKKGAFAQGRIPGSINIDWTEAVNYEESTFRNKREILALYNSKGIDSTSNIVVYCHSGVRSAHTTFVLTELLGFKNVKNYDGSWTEWSYHQLPLERDSLKIAQ